MNSGIYKITYLNTKEIYIGSSASRGFNERFNTHLRLLTTGKLSFSKLGDIS